MPPEPSTRSMRYWPASKSDNVWGTELICGWRIALRRGRDARLLACRWPGRPDIARVFGPGLELADPHLTVEHAVVDVAHAESPLLQEWQVDGLVLVVFLLADGQAALGHVAQPGVHAARPETAAADRQERVSGSRFGDPGRVQVTERAGSRGAGERTSDAIELSGLGEVDSATAVVGRRPLR